MLCDVVCRRWAQIPVIHAASNLAIRKELHGFLFLCIHVVPFSIIIMELCLAALRAARAPLIMLLLWYVGRYFTICGLVNDTTMSLTVGQSYGGVQTRIGDFLILIK